MLFRYFKYSARENLLDLKAIIMDVFYGLTLTLSLYNIFNELPDSNLGGSFGALLSLVVVCFIAALRLVDKTQMERDCGANYLMLGLPIGINNISLVEIIFLSVRFFLTYATIMMITLLIFGVMIKNYLISAIMAAIFFIPVFVSVFYSAMCLGGLDKYTLISLVFAGIYSGFIIAKQIISQGYNSEILTIVLLHTSITVIICSWQAGIFIKSSSI